jgi:hypothetical protein
LKVASGGLWVALLRLLAAPKPTRFPNFSFSASPFAIAQGLLPEIAKNEH